MAWDLATIVPSAKSRLDLGFLRNCHKIKSRITGIQNSRLFRDIKIQNYAQMLTIFTFIFRFEAIHKFLQYLLTEYLPSSSLIGSWKWMYEWIFAIGASRSPDWSLDFNTVKLVESDLHHLRQYYSEYCIFSFEGFFFIRKWNSSEFAFQLFKNTEMNHIWLQTIGSE